MRLPVLTLGAAVVGIAMFGSLALSQDNTPKGVTVKVNFPKEMMLTGDNKPGATTAKFTVKVHVKNDSDKGVEFSSANTDVSAKGLAAPQIRVEKTKDALLIDAGKTYDTDREVSLSMIVPAKGQVFDIEFMVYGKAYKGKVAAPK